MLAINTVLPDHVMSMLLVVVLVAIAANKSIPPDILPILVNVPCSVDTVLNSFLLHMSSNKSSASDVKLGIVAEFPYCCFPDGFVYVKATLNHPHTRRLTHLLCSHCISAYKQYYLYMVLRPLNCI